MRCGKAVLAAVLLAVAGCREDAVEPAPEALTGTWTAVRVNGSPLPYNGPVFGGAELRAGTFVLAAGRTFNALLALRVSVNGLPNTSFLSFSGSWQLSGSTITLTETGGGTSSGRARSDRVTVSLEGVELEFRRQPDQQHTLLTNRLEGSHYVYFTAPGDGVDTTWQEKYYAWVIDRLGVTPTRKLEYRKYRDRAHMVAITGRETNGFSDVLEPVFHTIWPTDSHEGVHSLVATLIGLPPALFNEGIAVAHQTNPPIGDETPRWNSVPLDDWVRQFHAQGRLPALATLITSVSFFSVDSNVTYPVAGSFVHDLIETEGMAKLKELFSRANFFDPAETSRSLFLSVYGITLDEAWNRWLSRVRS